MLRIRSQIFLVFLVLDNTRTEEGEKKKLSDFLFLLLSDLIGENWISNHKKLGLFL